MIRDKMERKILIVEDNTVNQKLLIFVLKPVGYLLLTAQDGEEAVKIARQEHPDLILMDLQLPKMSGFTAMELLRADPETASIPAIALTAHSLPEEQQRALKAGFDGFITKPINTRTFPDEVKMILENRVSR